MMSYEEVLDSYSKIIEDDLRNRFILWKRSADGYHPFMGQIYQALEEFVLRGGRRLAACSTLLVYKGYRGRIDQEIVRVCSGVELYRHAILVHDDIVDREMLRRGGDTLHRILGGRNEPLGQGSALFAGNILYALALEALMDSGFQPQEAAKAGGLLASEYVEVNESQVLDQLFEYHEPKVEEWEVMASKRAASLFRASMMAGAILAKAQELEVDLLGEAARHIGFAFDIQDDIIDTFASREQYGREPCGDIEKGKKPLHIVLALQKDQRLASYLSRKRQPTPKEILEIQEIVRSCGALEEAKAISREHAKEAQQLISETQMHEDVKSFFISFIRYVDESLEWYK